VTNYCYDSFAHAFSVMVMETAWTAYGDLYPSNATVRTEQQVKQHKQNCWNEVKFQEQ